MPGKSLDALRALFESSEAARRASRRLAREARVNLALDAGPARFTMEGGAPEFAEGGADDPDFTLTLPDAAVARLGALAFEDVATIGIEFFKLVRERDPSLKVRVRIEAPTARLVSHGYLGVLALGGLRVGWWLLSKGIRNPRAAIERLRGR